MENNYVFCSECEENSTCPDACKMDGCEFGIKIPKEGEENERSK